MSDDKPEPNSPMPPTSDPVPGYPAACSLIATALAGMLMAHFKVPPTFQTLLLQGLGKLVSLAVTSVIHAREERKSLAEKRARQRKLALARKRNEQRS